MAAELIFGTVQLGLPYGAANSTGQPSEKEAIAMLAHAAGAGIRWLDTARAYGEAESRIGAALRRADCCNLSVITKLSPLTGISSEDENAAVATAMADLARSRAALGSSRLPVLLLHRAEHLTAWGGAVWRRLLTERAAGNIGRLGVSVQSPEEALAAAANPDVQHVQLPINLLDWRWEEAAGALTARSDITVHARSVFLQGLLVCGNIAAWPQVEGETAATIMAQLPRLAAALGRDGADDLCLAFVRGLPWLHGVVVGMETEAQLRRNLALAARQPLTESERSLVRSALPKLPETLLNPALWPRKRVA